MTKCPLCGRKALKAVSRSHSNIATLRKQRLNLQTKTIDGCKMKICTRCIKTFKKNETAAQKAKPAKKTTKK